MAGISILIPNDPGQETYCFNLSAGRQAHNN